MRKLFATKGKLRLFRLIRGTGIRDDDAPLHTESSGARKPTKAFSYGAHSLVRDRMREVETLKAIVALQSRHDRWKAGGPL